MHIFLQLRHNEFSWKSLHIQFSLLLKATGTFSMKENWHTVSMSNNHKHLFSSPSWNTHWNQVLCVLTENKLHYVRNSGEKNPHFFCIQKTQQNKCSQLNNSFRPQYSSVIKLMPKWNGSSAGQKFPSTFPNTVMVIACFPTSIWQKGRHMGEGKHLSQKVSFHSIFCNDFLMPLRYSVSRKQKIKVREGKIHVLQFEI